MIILQAKFTHCLLWDGMLLQSPVNQICTKIVHQLGAAHPFFCPPHPYVFIASKKFRKSLHVVLSHIFLYVVSNFIQAEALLLKEFQAVAESESVSLLAKCDNAYVFSSMQNSEEVLGSIK